MSFNFFEYPFPFPCGEAIRRHVARGVDYATLKTTPSHERGSLRQRQG